MKHLGIEVPVKNVPELDPGVLPLGKFCTAVLKDAKKPLDIAVERAGGEVAVYKTFIHGTPDMAEADIYYVDRIIKMLLWMKGGFKVYLSGDQAVYEALKATYRVGGARAFDADFMSNVYEKPFEVVYCDQVPAEKSNPQAVGRHLGGCRIGFDAGGSDRKVSAVIDGEPVFSEEVVWFPKTTSDPNYHYEGIVSALKAAAEHMPRVDAVGVSSAGISLSADLSPAEKLKEVQKLMDQGGSPAEAIYRSIGVYLGHSLALYHHFYGFKHVLLLGRVMSGRGGDIILDTCKKVLADEYPEVAGLMNPTLPDEKARRVGQSVAAASLPELR